jgi:hypothetical protein
MMHLAAASALGWNNHDEHALAPWNIHERDCVTPTPQIRLYEIKKIDNWGVVGNVEEALGRGNWLAVAATSGHEDEE